MARSDKAAATHPVTSFWRWWESDGAVAFRSAIERKDYGDLPAEMTGHVHAIDPGLTWELGAGTVAAHRLTVSAGGVAATRRSAERWRRAGPAADKTWEYASSKQADPGALSNSLEFGDHRIELDQVEFDLEVDDAARRVHVRSFHPAFREMPHDVRGQITFLLLDWLIGEDDVERWIGSVEFPDARPMGARPARELEAAVRQLADAREPDSWAIAQLTDRRGAAVVARFRTDVRWIDQPTYDVHHTVVLAYPKEANGMPKPGTTAALDELEDGLERAISGRGIVLAHETGAGVRTVHLYTDSEDQNATEAVRAAARVVRAKVNSESDPQWQAVRVYTG
jgi:hypothetical protein